MLTDGQRQQIERQIAYHQRTKPYNITIPISDERVLRGYRMYPNVLRPMSSISLGNYLYDHPKALQGRRILDMGCGSGILGIIAALRGAAKVVLCDVNPQAVENSIDNVHRFGVESICQVIRSDLFENVRGSFNEIIFAHPYFPGKPWPGVPVTTGMLDAGALIDRFLTDAKEYVTGPILMPFLELAGSRNNPLIRGPRHGYAVKTVTNITIRRGLQKGRFMVYELRCRGRSNSR